MTVILVTCSRNQEARCTSECIQLLEKVTEADLQVEEDPAESETLTDFADELAKEVAVLRNAKGKAFQSLGMGEVSCMVAVKVVPSLGNPVDIVQKLFTVSKTGAENSARHSYFVASVVG